MTKFAICDQGEQSIWERIQVLLSLFTALLLLLGGGHGAPRVAVEWPGWDMCPCSWLSYTPWLSWISWVTPECTSFFLPNFCKNSDCLSGRAAIDSLVFPEEVGLAAVFRGVTVPPASEGMAWYSLGKPSSVPRISLCFLSHFFVTPHWGVCVETLLCFQPRHSVHPASYCNQASISWKEKHHLWRYHMLARMTILWIISGKIRFG